jgi:hypothetical protein
VGVPPGSSGLDIYCGGVGVSSKTSSPIASQIPSPSPHPPSEPRADISFPAYTDRKSKYALSSLIDRQHIAPFIRSVAIPGSAQKFSVVRQPSLSPASSKSNTHRKALQARSNSLQYSPFQIFRRKARSISQNYFSISRLEKAFLLAHLAIRYFPSES